MRNLIVKGIGLGILLLSLAGGGALFVSLIMEKVAWSKDLAVDANAPTMTSLNIRLSHRPITPPADLVKQTLPLPNIRAARSLIAPSPKAAILEDDHHQRVLVLSTRENGELEAQLLDDLDLSPKIPFITACAHERECAYDRRPITGGLGCVAICVQQALEPNDLQ